MHDNIYRVNENNLATTYHFKYYVSDNINVYKVKNVFVICKRSGTVSRSLRYMVLILFNFSVGIHFFPEITTSLMKTYHV